MKSKEPTPKVYYPRIPLDTRVMTRISMDIKVMPKSILGYICILVCVCEYTNWVKAIPGTCFFSVDPSAVVQHSLVFSK